jgi:hypothetical protein
MMAKAEIREKSTMRKMSKLTQINLLGIHIINLLRPHLIPMETSTG